jgi:hypothetical protein
MKGGRALFPPYCVKRARLTGTIPFPALTTRLYVAWNGSYDFSTVSARPELNKDQGRLYSGRISCSLRSVILYVQIEAFAGPEDERISRFCPY